MDAPTVIQQSKTWGGASRTNDAVDIRYSSEGGYFVGDTAGGEWLTYTVNVPSAGSYNLSLRYASKDGGGSVTLFFAGKDKTGVVELPATGGTQTWSNINLANEVALDAGVQSLKLFVEAGGFGLSSHEVLQISFIEKAQRYAHAGRRALGHGHCAHAMSAASRSHPRRSGWAALSSDIRPSTPRQAVVERSR